MSSNVSESISELATALAKAQGELQSAKKDSQNPHFRSKYANLAACWEAWQEVGPKNGLSVVQMVKDAGERQGVLLNTMLLHSSGQYISSESFWPCSKMDAQGLGSATSYGKRYALCAMVGVVADDDDDAQAAVSQAAPKTAPVVQDMAQRFTDALTKYSEDPVRLKAIRGEAEKAGLTEVVRRADALLVAAEGRGQRKVG